MAHLLRIIEASHVDDGECYELWRESYATQDHRLDAINRLDRTLPNHDCMTADRCFLADVLDSDGWTILASIEVSAQAVHRLLGATDLTHLRRSEDMALSGHRR